jgi:hypothetical protein
MKYPLDVKENVELYSANITDNCVTFAALPHVSASAIPNCSQL